MKRATLDAVETAESLIDLAEGARRSRPSPGTGIATLNSARVYLGTGPRKGPRIEAAWRRVAMKYEVTKNLTLRDLGDQLALPKNWRLR
jgi:hypothetical protein